MTRVLTVYFSILFAMTAVEGHEVCTDEKQHSVSLRSASEDGWQRLIGNVNRGDYVVLTAIGHAWSNGSFNINAPNSDVFSLEGIKEVPSNIPGGAKSLLDPKANFGALIGKIGNGIPFRIGEGTSISAGDTGALFLQMNDVVNGHSDNRGEVTVKWKFCIK